MVTIHDNAPNTMKASLYESIYFKWAKKHQGMIITCFLVSAFLCILTYPGVIYSDSYTRIEFASSLKEAIHAFSRGDSMIHEYESWLTVIPSFFIMLSEELVGSIVLCTFGQCFFLFLASYILSDFLTERHRTLMSILITLSPVLWAYGVYYEASVGCSIGIIFIIVLIWKWGLLEANFDKILTMVLLFICSFVCFGCRANAFTILPALFLIIFLKYRKAITRLLLIGGIIMGMMLSSLIPRMLNINTMSSFAGSFVWEIVSTIQSMDEKKQENYCSYLDDIFGEGATEKAIQSSNYDGQYDTINPLFDGKISKEAISREGIPKLILEKYIKLIISEPKTFMKTKWVFISHTLGIGKTINFYEYDYNRWDAMDYYNYNDSLPRKHFVSYINAFMEFLVIFRRPWILFSVALILIIFNRIKIIGRKSEITLCEAAFLVAMFYYGAFIINTQSFEFRYFFPSWLLLFLIIVTLSSDILCGRKKSEVLYIIACALATFVCFFGAYNTYTKEGDDIVVNVENEGKILYSSDGNSLYTMGNKLYFVLEKGSDKYYSFLLHYWSDDGMYINNDFMFQDKEVTTSFWKKSVAVVEMPEISECVIEFGQYYYDYCLWKHEVRFPDM